jgi:hypothetical protein
LLKEELSPNFLSFPSAFSSVRYRKEEGGRRKEEGGRRKEEGERMKVVVALARRRLWENIGDGGNINFIFQ